jgi:hypothetical protein
MSFRRRSNHPGLQVIALCDEWDASNLASGVYLYRLQAGNYVEMRKMVLMR